MTYDQTIDYLYSTLPLFSRTGPAAYKKDLTNTVALCAAIGNPQDKIKTVHVGGTNGKGSVSHMLAGIFAASGYKTGLYTSPHLYNFRERIRINGEMVDPNFVVRFVQDIRPYVEQIQPSFFELTVAMAFQYFFENKVDMAIIEVGLGGRLDSTNIIIPQLSVITNIGLDHTNILGDTMEAIAFEKSGIIKKGITVVIGESLPETKPVFQTQANSKDSEIAWAQEKYKPISTQLLNDQLLIRYLDKESKEMAVATDLTGNYQVKNVATVLTAIDLLREKGWELPDNSIQSALKQVKQKTGLAGRWEVVRQQPKLVLDVAHNREGIQQLVLQLAEMKFKKLHLVMGLVSDKDPAPILGQLPTDANFYFTQAQIPRALPAEQLKQSGELFHLTGKSFATVNQAIDAALVAAGSEDLIVVCGSIFLVAEVNKDQYRN